jgi:hypothetical protein
MSARSELSGSWIWAAGNVPVAGELTSIRVRRCASSDSGCWARRSCADGRVFGAGVSANSLRSGLGAARPEWTGVERQIPHEQGGTLAIHTTA